MKKLLMFLAIGAISSIAVSAQQLKEGQVPAAAKSAFQKQYPNTTAKWEKEKGNYEVNFKKDGKTMSAVIDKAGTIIETETDIAINELPQSVQSYLKTHYKGAKVKEAAKIVKANGEVNYEGEVNGKDVIFDSNGKFIKEVKD
ncbi:MAG: hypothetical protein JWQ09_927 [Segetibacter sp.]|nr:hypothetical protein [Segetibacter sp.]